MDRSKQRIKLDALLNSTFEWRVCVEGLGWPQKSADLTGVLEHTVVAKKRTQTKTETRPEQTTQTSTLKQKLKQDPNKNSKVRRPETQTKNQVRRPETQTKT